MPIRDDSAGSYGQWDDSDLSWLDYLKATGSDIGSGTYNALANITGALSPIGTSEQGNMAFQVPPMVSGIADSYARLAGTPSRPGNAYNITGVPELDAPIQADMSNVLLSLYGGNAVSGLAKIPEGAVGAIPGGRVKNGYLVRPNADGTAYYAHRDLGIDPAAPETHAGMLGRPIGSAENLYTDATGAHIDNLSVSPNFRRRGVASTMYDAIAEDFGSISPSKQLEPDGMAFWQSRDPDAVAKYRQYDRQFHSPEKLQELKARELKWRDLPGIDPSKIDARLQQLDNLIGETLFSDNKPSIFGSAAATAGEQNIPDWLRF